MRSVAYLLGEHRRMHNDLLCPQSSSNYKHGLQGACCRLMCCKMEEDAP